MIARIVKLISILFLIFVVAYLYHYNSQEITLILGPNRILQTRAAHVVLGLFLTGFVVASLFAALISLRHFFAMRRLQQQVRRMQEQRERVIDGRNALALGDYKKARTSFQKALQADPEDRIARILLADATYHTSGAKDSLAILERLRQENKQTIEGLLVAAERNLELENFTAAYDNSALVLAQSPGNSRALERVVAAASGLEKFDEAIEYQQQLIQRASGDAYDAAQLQLARLKVRRALAKHGEQPEKLQATLETILKDHRDFPDALTLLAEVEDQQGHRENATKLRKRLYELTGSSTHLETIARSWLAAERPDVAIAQVEAALAAAHGKTDSLEGQLFLAHLQLDLEMIDQARATIASLASRVAERPDLGLTYTVLKARLMRRDQDLAAAFSLVIDTLETSAPLPTPEMIRSSLAAGLPLDSWALRLNSAIQSQSIAASAS